MSKNKTNNAIFKTAVLLENSQSIKLRFPFEKDLINQIKTTFSHRTYNPKGKYWIIPLSLDNCLILKKMKFRFTEELREWANNAYSKNKISKDTFTIPGLKDSLFDYQKEGILYAERKGGRVLIADDMGLGKTIQGLGFIQLHRNEGCSIVVCPASVKYNWEAEALEWLPDIKTMVLEGTKPSPIPEKVDIVILNFEIVQFWLDVLKEANPRTLIIDEIHYIKNNGTKKKRVARTQAAKKLAKGIKYIIGLSGTPIENKPVEFYNIIQIINPSIFPNNWYFKHRYCGAKHNGFGWSFDGASNTEELHGILKSKLMIRRLKKDVLKDLPDKLYSFVPLKIDNWKEYKQAENDFIEYLQKLTEIEVREKLQKHFSDDLENVVDVVDHKLEKLKEERTKNANPFTQMEILKQMVAKGKLEQIIRWVWDFLETGKKIVLFCEHRFVIDRLMTEFGNKIVKIDGSVPSTKRKAVIENFQNNKNVKIFIGNKAAEIGITLTAASDVGIIEYPNKPGSLRQRIDRTHRIGQKNTVNVWYFVGIHTIDEKLAHMLDEKQKMIDAVLDGKEMEMKESLLTNLVNSYRK